MKKRTFHEAGRSIDWEKTSDDYAAYRPGYPDEFWRRIDPVKLVGPG
ncbi:MAG: hypothetical protein P1V20_30555 [Verrucomicrobiales bacterium]|nr:hypothetical protein [Verrucomicrobiales bacterium]